MFKEIHPVAILLAPRKSKEKEVVGGKLKGRQSLWARYFGTEPAYKRLF